MSSELIYGWVQRCHDTGNDQEVDGMPKERDSRATLKLLLIPTMVSTVIGIVVGDIVAGDIGFVVGALIGLLLGSFGTLLARDHGLLGK